MEEGEDNAMNQSRENMESESPARQEVELEDIGEWIEPNHAENGEGGRDGGGSAEDSTEEGFEGGLGVEETHEVVKRKRGRPKKYDLNGDMVSPMSELGFSSSPLKACSKRGRGRPRGSGKLQLLASLGGFIAETAGGNFTPHVVEVQKGEDVVSSIASFSQAGPRAVCVLSATGVVSSVMITQSSSSNGILRCEGRFEILSLSGSFTYGETSGGAHRKNGILTVSLAKPDGRVFGGGVAGPLLAAGPIQLVVASFKQNISKDIKRRHSTESSTGNSDCATPTSVLLETNPEGAGNLVVTRNQNMNRNTSPDINGSVP